MSKNALTTCHNFLFAGNTNHTFQQTYKVLTAEINETSEEIKQKLTSFVFFFKLTSTATQQQTAQQFCGGLTEVGKMFLRSWATDCVKDPCGFCF